MYMGGNKGTRARKRIPMQNALAVDGPYVRAVLALCLNLGAMLILLSLILLLAPPISLLACLVSA